MAMREGPYEELGVIEKVVFGVTHDRTPDQARLALTIKLMRGHVDIILTTEESLGLIVARGVYDVAKLKGTTVIMQSNDFESMSKYLRPD